MCFIINDPKKREVFAANYRDRIVHHLYYNFVHEMFERTFISDTYSCIKNRGTHFGIERLYKHIRKESQNYKRECFILKMDIRGYFMHINRELLLKTANETLNNIRYKKIDKKTIKVFDEIIDFDFIFYLTKVLILLDPTDNCYFVSKKEDWKGLPESKSLFHSNKGYGLPIGNLTSQLFSNLFMNKFDQYCKRNLKCKHYGRYVDDFYIVSHDKCFLHKIIPLIESFLSYEMKLEINKGKTRITSYYQGVEFLGSYIKPYRKYLSNSCIRRIKKKINLNENNDWKNGKDIETTINSYLGIFSHNKSNKIKKEIFSRSKKLNEIGIFNKSYTKFWKMI